MKLLVTGDREWRNYLCVAQALSALHAEYPNLFLVEGGARGADRIAGSVGRQLGITVDEKPADWKKYGLGAGPIRNQQMLDEHPDLDYVLAFHDNLAASKGTKDMVSRALMHQLPVTIIKSDYTTWDVRNPNLEDRNELIQLLTDGLLNLIVLSKRLSPVNLILLNERRVQKRLHA